MLNEDVGAGPMTKTKSWMLWSVRVKRPEAATPTLLSSSLLVFEVLRLGRMETLGCWPIRLPRR